jgi:hypothetical protein
MSIPEDLVRMSNDALARIPLDATRLRELPIELAQFAEVAERARSRVAFDQEVGDFRLALRALAWEE